MPKFEQPPTPEEPEIPSESLQEIHERKEQLWDEAKQLLAEGNPWKALPKKAEAIGLKPLEGFYSMAKQDLHKRPDLMWLGHPLADSRQATERFRIQATAKLYPGTRGAEASLTDISEAANQIPNPGNRTAIEQARKALDEINAERRRLQYQRAFDEVGVFTYNSGFLSARGGNGDLLVARESPETRKTLEEANYRNGHEYGITLNVPFNSDEASRRDVEWKEGTGAEYVDVG